VPAFVRWRFRRRLKHSECVSVINTIIKTTSVCNASSVSDRLAGWPVTVGVIEVGVVSQPGADAERYRCACSHCTQGLAGRGDGYQCGLDWGRVLVFEMRGISTTLNVI